MIMMMMMAQNHRYDDGMMNPTYDDGDGDDGDGMNHTQAKKIQELRRRECCIHCTIHTKMHASTIHVR